MAEKENLLVSGKKLLTYTSTDELERHEKGPWSWDQQEVKALVMFILFHCKGDSWPSHKNNGDVGRSWKVHKNEEWKSTSEIRYIVYIIIFIIIY